MTRSTAFDFYNNIRIGLSFTKVNFAQNHKERASSEVRTQEQ